MDSYQKLLHEDFSTLISLCNTNSTYNEICNNDNFWQDKLHLHFGSYIAENKPPNISWYNYYISQYKTIIPIDDQRKPIGQIYTTSTSSVKDLILTGIKMMGLEPDGNFSVKIKIRPYIMYSHDISNVWYQNLGNLGVLGYLERDDNNKLYYPYLNDRTNIWSVFDQAVIEIFPLTLRTQSKVRHSYLKLSSGQFLGSEYISS